MRLHVFFTPGLEQKLPGGSAADAEGPAQSAGRWGSAAGPEDASSGSVSAPVGLCCSSELARPSRRTRRFLLFSEHRCSSHMSCLLSHSSRSREERSPSVEIIYEGPVGSNATQPPAHKRHRKGGHRSRAGRYRCSSTGGQQRAAFQQNLTSSHGSAG